MSGTGLDPAPGAVLPLSGRLVFDSVPAVWTTINPALAAQDRIRVDLGDVQEIDSAGLAMIVDWIAQAECLGKQLILLRSPAKLRALARIGDLEGLLDRVAG